MSQNSIYNELKIALMETGKNLTTPLDEVIDLGNIDPDIVELNEIFNNVIADRDDAFTKFEAILDEKVNLFETLTNLLVSAFYIKKMDPLIEDLYNSFDFIEVAHSESFDTNLSSLIALLNDSSAMNAESLGELVDYFIVKRDYISSIFSFSSSLEFEEDNYGNRRLLLDGVEVSEYDSIEYLMFYLLNVISLVTYSNYSIYVSEINTFPSMIRYIRERLFASDGPLNISISGIVEMLDTMNYIILKRQEIDDLFFTDYSAELQSELDTLNTFISSNLVDMNLATIEALKDMSMFTKVRLNYTNIKDILSALLYETISSIKLANRTIESYYPFFAVNKNYSLLFLNSFKLLEDIDFTEDVEEFDGDEVIKFLFNYSLSDFTPITKFSTFLEDIEDYSYKDIFNLFLLYSGSFLNKLEMTSISDYIFGYSLTSMIRKGLISSNEISETYNTIKEKELILSSENDIVIMENINNEILDSSLKSISPSFEKLDLLSFSEIIDGTIEDETGFINSIYFLLLTGLLEKKNLINKNILKIINIFNIFKNNYKMLYIKKILVDVLTKIKDISGGITERKLLTNQTLSELENFLRYYDEDDINSILASYGEIWNFFYGASEDSLDLILKTGGNLKTYLQEGFE